VYVVLKSTIMIYHFSTNPMVLRDAFFGRGTLQIHLDDVKCTGTEISLSQCPHRAWGSHNCDHSRDVSISCTPGNYLKAYH
jgi:deleted-in-malignant-brain-tumors protein 1